MAPDDSAPRHQQSTPGQGRSILVSDPDDLIAQTVPFVPPVPQELTDELVLSSLRQLPHVFQEIILLCDVEDLWSKEAAEVLNIPPGTVMSRLHRGRARLRAELAAAEAASILQSEPLKEISCR